MKVLFILSGNISTTPRALKLLNFLLDNNHICEIIMVNRAEQWLIKDVEIIKYRKYKTTIINLGRKPFFPWLIASAKQKISSILYLFLKQNIDVSAYASNKSSIILWELLKRKNKLDYNLILGFGAGAFFPSWKLSEKWSIPFGYDVEDYFPGELIRKGQKNEQIRRKFLMRYILPEAAFLTFASPLICKKTIELINYNKKFCIINNCFPKNEFMPPKIDGGKLKFVWFSQTISFGRGLELFLDTICNIDADITITLIGEMDVRFEAQLPPGIRNKITVLPALEQKKLHKELANHDVGLALEQSGIDENRQYCLTNKIFAYMQSGLYVLATNTLAQKQFIKSFSDSGIICEQNMKGIKKALTFLIKNKTSIRDNSIKRYEYFKKYSWENEVKKYSILISNKDY